MAKPLMNRLLLENSNKAIEPALALLRKRLLPDWNEESASIAFQTPQKSDDIRQQARQITGLEIGDRVTARVLFRKVAKGIDQKDFVIAQHKLRIKQLEARVLQLEPRKRRKVQTSPNSRFANIGGIREAQIAAGDRQVEQLESGSLASIASTLSHITIED